MDTGNGSSIAAIGGYFHIHYPNNNVGRRFDASSDENSVHSIINIISLIITIIIKNRTIIIIIICISVKGTSK
jgi:hypothetical protein